MFDKKLVTKTLSSRAVGLERRLETLTTSSHEEKTTKNKKMGTEFISPSKVRTAKDSSLLGPKRIRQEKSLTKRRFATKTGRTQTVMTQKQCKAMASSRGKPKEEAVAAARIRLRLKRKRRQKRQHSFSCKRTQGR